MTICRYFAQGTCRFGDRCRFEHVTDDYNHYQQSNTYNQRNNRNKNVRYGAPESEYSNYDDYSYKGRQSANHYNEDYRGYSQDRYNQPSHSTRYSGYENQQHNRYGQWNEPTRQNEKNYGRKQHQFSNYRENENTYGQNRYRWLSDDYKKQAHSENEYSNDSYSTSTPKGKPSFSFKVPESEIKKESSSVFQTNEKDQLLIESVKEDAKSSEYGGLWPFTCYFPCPNKHGFPGFYDVSPEELRFAAYEAEKNNKYETYLSSVQNALIQVKQQRSQLQIPTPQLLSTLRRIRDGEDLYSTSKFIDPIASVQGDNTLVESMDTPIFSLPTNSAAASFSFKLPDEADSASKAASSFSFKLPAGTEIKEVPSTVPDGDVDVYTPLGNLSEEEKEQFTASTFALGKIPTKPPPQVFCS